MSPLRSRRSLSRLPAVARAVALAVSLCASAPVPARAAELSIPQLLEMAVAGTYDRQADSRARVKGDRMRREAIWTSRVPFDARALRVRYDSDQRVVAWRVDVIGAPPLAALTGAQLREVGRVKGAPVYRLTGGRFDGALAVRSGERASVYSAAYALRYAPGLARYVGR